MPGHACSCGPITFRGHGADYALPLACPSCPSEYRPVSSSTGERAAVHVCRSMRLRAACTCASVAAGSSGEGMSVSIGRCGDQGCARVQLLQLGAVTKQRPAKMPWTCRGRSRQVEAAGAQDLPRHLRQHHAFVTLTDRLNCVHAWLPRAGPVTQSLGTWSEVSQRRPPDRPAAERTIYCEHSLVSIVRMGPFM